MATSTGQSDVTTTTEEKDEAQQMSIIGLGDELVIDDTAIPNLPEFGPLPESAMAGSGCASHSKDIKDNHGLPGRIGLYNLGNTCFMNSGLQCLVSSPPLVRYFLEVFNGHVCPRQTLLGQFHQLFCKIWSGKYSILYPRDFKSILGFYHSQFQDYRQHDCQEFLALLLDSLHEQMNTAKNEPINHAVMAGPNQCSSIDNSQSNMNNRSVTNQDLDSDQMISKSDQPHSSVSGHSSLTFDNMKTEEQVEKVSSLTENGVSTDTKDVKLLINNSSKFGSLSPQTTFVSEESNQSNASEHSEQSSDSEQCSVIQNLKLRSSPVSTQSTPPPVSENICSSSLGNGSKSCSFVTSSDVESVDMETGSVQKMADGDHLSRQRLFGSKSDMVRSVAVDKSFSPSQSSFSEKSGDTVVLNNAISSTSMPSLDDLYAKETKTLNTNVLATGYLSEDVTVDSDKFAKQDNVNRPQSTEDMEILNNVLAPEVDKNDEKSSPRGIKDVNLRADTCKKSRLCNTSGAANFLGDSSEDCFSLNNVKRMKFEGTEKNLQMQELSKINKNKILFSDIQAELNAVADAAEADSESDIEDREMEVDNDNSDDESSVSEAADLAVSLPNRAYTQQDVLAAENSWRKYLSKNDSIIVDTFQGQFKSTVICSECSHVSVTFEPFMYLSVPVPHAMERQLCVIFVPHHSEPVRYLLTMHKQDRIQKVKDQLRNMTGQENCEIIMAEVLDWHISRILEDNVMLRYVNDANRKLYAFEMVPQVTLDHNNAPQDMTPSVNDDSSSGTKLSGFNAATKSDIFSDIGMFSSNSIPTVTVENTSTLDQSNADLSIPEVIGVFDNQNEKAQSGFDENQVDQSGIDMTGTGLWEWSERADSASVPDTGSDLWNVADTTMTVEKQTEQSAETEVTSSTVGLSEWRSCAICLEELTDNELMVHTSCGGTFCPSCLEMSLQHYGDAAYCCPVCSSPAVMTEDFVPLADAASHKPKTRIVTIPVTYRCDMGDKDQDQRLLTLFSHPNILNLPSNLAGTDLYSIMDKIVPFIADYKIVLTDGQGLHCSRCLFMEHCSGCEISRDGEAMLRPGDHLTVAVDDVTLDQIEAAQKVQDHKSMERLRPDVPITLFDCFNAFTQSEMLDEHNPWFCPQCQKNQRAQKTMTVWKYPDLLIMHLKRFVYHELSSTKIDNKVIFPVENLDLSEFISGPKTAVLKYNLYSLVCHFGGANSGHYTSYSKHPIDDSWYYYNDETVSLQSPGQDEYSSAYVLFYQRKGTNVTFSIPDNLDLEEEGDSQVAPPDSSMTVMLYQPPEGEVTLDIKGKHPAEGASQTDTQQAEADSTYDFYS